MPQMSIGAGADEEFRSYARTITETDLVTFTCFAGLKLPIFIDEEYARASPYGGRIVPGFLTASIMGAMMESMLGERILAGLGFDRFRFTAPVRPGDTVHARIRITGRRPTREPGREILSLLVRGFNQRNEQVVEFATSLLVRAAATGQG